MEELALVREWLEQVLSESLKRARFFESPVAQIYPELFSANKPESQYRLGFTRYLLWRCDRHKVQRGRRPRRA